MGISNILKRLQFAVYGGAMIAAATSADAQNYRPTNQISYSPSNAWRQTTDQAAQGQVPVVTPELMQQMSQVDPQICEACEPTECECDSGGLGDPWTLSGSICKDPWVTVGGWASMGYHSRGNDLFNSNPSNFDLHQGWLFAEKSAVRDDGKLGFGFRFDILYGVDAPDTQAFGNTQDVAGNPRGWDNGAGWTRGGNYGWAIPQAYVEVAKGDWSVIAGHFFTLIGYAVIPSKNNFFYSRPITFYNSEPFTHTGAVGTYTYRENTKIYAGWSAGWDTGFDQFEDGSNFLGGFSHAINDDVDFYYFTSFGDFGARGREAYAQSLVLDARLTEKIQYIAHSDVLRVDSTGEDNFSLENFLFYDLTERIRLGTRIEWWKGDAITGYAPHGGVIPAGKGSLSYYAWTSGFNYKLSPNVVIRPEYRYDWSPAAQYNQGYFGFDVVATF